MGGSGDPLADCQDFNALLIATTEALQAFLPPLSAQEESLSSSEVELREGLRGADSGADALEHEVAESGPLAVGALHELATFATDTRESAVAVENAAGEAEEAAGHHLDAFAERLHDGFEELVSTPFATLEHDLTDEQSEFTQAATDTEAALTTLSGAFATVVAEIGKDVDVSRESLEQAVHAADDLEDQVTAVSLDGTDAGYALNHAVPDALAENIKSRIEDMKNAFQAWEQRLDTEATLLQSSVDSLAEAGSTALQGALEPLQAAMAALAQEWSRAELEADQVAADLEAAAPALETAAGLASRIGEMQQRIEWIQQVVDAMDTK